MSRARLTKERSWSAAAESTQGKIFLQRYSLCPLISHQVFGSPLPLQLEVGEPALAVFLVGRMPSATFSSRDSCEGISKQLRYEIQLYSLLEYRPISSSLHFSKLLNSHFFIKIFLNVPLFKGAHPPPPQPTALRGPQI